MAVECVRHSYKDLELRLQMAINSPPPSDRETPVTCQYPDMPSPIRSFSISVNNTVGESVPMPHQLAGW